MSSRVPILQAVRVSQTQTVIRNNVIPSLHKQDVGLVLDRHISPVDSNEISGIDSSINPNRAI